jgi:hypothetical protein
VKTEGISSLSQPRKAGKKTGDRFSMLSHTLSIASLKRCAKALATGLYEGMKPTSKARHEHAGRLVQITEASARL